MARDTTTVTDPNAAPKKKRTRSNKPKRFFMLYSGPEITLENLAFARNGDEALDLVDAAAKSGTKLNFLRVNMPVTAKKEVAPAS